MKHRAKWIFAGCCLLGLIITGLVCNTIGLYYTSLSGELGGSMTQVTMIMSFLVGGGLIGIIFAGKLLQEISIRILLTLAAGLVGGGIFLSSWFESLWQYYIVWAVVGFCTPLLISVTIPTLLGNWFEEKLGCVLGIAYGMAGLGGTVFNPLIGGLIEACGFRAAFRIEGAIVLIVLLPLTLFTFQLQPEEKKDSKSFVKVKKTLSRKQIYRQKSFSLFVGANILLTIVANMQQQISTHVQNMGFSLHFAANVVAAVMLGCAVGNLLIGFMLDRWRPALVLILFAVSGLVGWLGVSTAVPSGVLLAAGLLLGMGQALFQVGLPFCVRKVSGGAEYSQVFAAICLPGSAIGIFSSALGGIFYDIRGSYHGLLILLSVLCLLGGICMVGALKAK